MTQQRQCQCGSRRFTWRIKQWETGKVVETDGEPFRQHQSSGELAGTVRDDVMCDECGLRQDLDDLDRVDENSSPDN